MKKLPFLLAASALSAGSMIVAAPAAAQQTTSGIQGVVTDENGAALGNASVVVTDTRTGQTSALTAGSGGRFSVSNLPTGGPYTVTATADGFQGQTVNDLFINLSGATSLTFELASVAGDVSEDVIIITGARAQATTLAIGPGQSIGTEQLESLPSITRDVRDFIRIDPRVNIERDNEVDRISCLGGNDRANTFTVDGIAQADLFGLNGTPFASRNSLPLPFDAIKETAVEFAPFDVQYGGFTGCAINAVTKSGTNKFSGSAFFEYRDDSFRGDTAGGETFETTFEEKRWGATLGGPILKDRLFFFLGYEELDAQSPIEIGPFGAGFPSERDFVTTAQFNEFASIAQSVYGRDVGPIPNSAAQTDVRYFGRVDAYITDDHRLELTYQRLEESNIEADFAGDEYSGLNAFEDEGTISDYYSARLFSQWSDKFSTEFRYSLAEVGDVQGPVGGGEAQSDNPLPRFEVLVSNDGENGTLTSGPGIFRSANQLDTQVQQVKLLANYEAGDHYITVGYEQNDLEVFNLFAINATGTIFFRSLDDFRNGIVAPGFFSSVFGDADDLADGALGGATIASTPSGDINQAAAEWSRIIDTVYIQDDWSVTDQLNVLLGVRADFYSGDAPRRNPNFEERYGFSNSLNFGSLGGVVLPRVAATYDFDNEGFFYGTTLNAGVGIFSGGDPAVWLSNAFSNNGFSTANGDTFDDDCAGFDGTVVTDGQFTGFPNCARVAGSRSAAAGLADTQSTDPNLEIATVTRANLGFGTRFGDGSGGFFDEWQLNLDYIYSRYNNPYNFVDLSQTPNVTINGGFTVDGRPIYAAIDPLQDGCNATLAPTGGTPPVWSNVTADCFGTRRDDEIQLTNSDGYDSHVFSIILRKSFNSGLFTDGGNVFFNAGYAYTDADERRTNDNSTATSGFDRTAAFDRQNPAIRPSSYAVEHNFSSALTLREEFFGDNATTLGIFFRATSGRPYSLTFDGGGVFADGSSGSDNALLYIPSGINDPNVSPSSDPDAVADLIDYVNSTNCDFTPGQSIGANTCRNDWFFDMDLRFSQEIPGPGNLFGVEDKIEVFATFDNFLNFLNSDWNVLRTRPQQVDVVDGGVDAEGRYIIDGFRPDDDNDPRFSSSIWRMKIGVSYQF